MEEKALMDETELPLHPWLTDPRTGEPLRALGFFRGRPLWPMMGGSGEGEGGDDDAGDEGTDDDADDTEEAKASKEKKPAGEQTVSLARFKKLEKHLSAADSKREAAEKELQQIRDKDLPAVEKAERDRAEAVTKAEKLESKYAKLARQHAFLLETQQQKVTWKNPKSALKLAELDELEINEDGSVEGISDAVAALLKDHDYLVDKPKKDDDEDEEDTTTARKPKSGSPVGGKQKKTVPPGHMSDEELRNTFPALRK